MSWFSKALRNVRSTVQHTVSSVAHLDAGRVVGSVGAAVGLPVKNGEIAVSLAPKNIPGELLNLSLAGPHLLANATAGVASLAGDKTLAREIIGVDQLVNRTLDEHPIQDIELAGGVALAVTGVATGPGLALAGTGLAGLMRAAARDSALKSSKATGGTGKPAGVATLPTDKGEAANDPRRAPSWLSRVEKRLAFVFGKGGRPND